VELRLKNEVKTGPLGPVQAPNGLSAAAGNGPPAPAKEPNEPTAPDENQKPGDCNGQIEQDAQLQV